MDDPREVDEHEAKRRERAYAIWEREGRPEGRHGDHWDAAGMGDEADRPDAMTPTPSGTQSERDARGGGEQPIPASAPKNPNARLLRRGGVAADGCELLQRARVGA